MIVEESNGTRLEVFAELHFSAENVGIHEEQFTPEFAVHGIHFAEGDSDGGQHWSFSRGVGEDDDGVCIVKEPQQIVVYGGISALTMSRSCLVCDFDELSAKKTAVRRLTISYQCDDVIWCELTRQAALIFNVTPNFEIGS